MAPALDGKRRGVLLAWVMAAVIVFRLGGFPDGAKEDLRFVGAPSPARLRPQAMDLASRITAKASRLPKGEKPGDKNWKVTGYEIEDDDIVWANPVFKVGKTDDSVNEGAQLSALVVRTVVACVVLGIAGTLMKGEEVQYTPEQGQELIRRSLSANFDDESILS
eukprot:TRINITY_DN34361_c0_g1_i1.p1 TRINITY_DN34361_c0_g1~~TRINITY_DN34361_c0_g1_i1.p1  ORF type:complete len:164 (+),score=42.39 TRINITY_DN34361_c0_g1_i1:112-603(+)